MSTDERTDQGRGWTGGDLARRLRRRRGALGLSQEEVATRARMAGGVGRAAFNLAGRLTVVPVNFEMYKGQVVFRTSGTNAVARYGADSVSFEVDRIDEGMREGWSVLISGRARKAAGKELQQLRSALAVEPWVGGARGVYIVIEPEQISGRRLRAW